MKNTHSKSIEFDEFSKTEHFYVNNMNIMKQKLTGIPELPDPYPLLISLPKVTTYLTSNTVD